MSATMVKQEPGLGPSDLEDRLLFLCKESAEDGITQAAEINRVLKPCKIKTSHHPPSTPFIGIYKCYYCSNLQIYLGARNFNVLWLFSFQF